MKNQGLVENACIVLISVLVGIGIIAIVQVIVWAVFQLHLVDPHSEAIQAIKNEQRETNQRLDNTEREIERLKRLTTD